MKKIVALQKYVLPVLTLCLAGCATFGKPEQAYISTNPPGAQIALSQSGSNSVQPLPDRTPCSFTFQRKFWDVYVVVSKEGYETEKVRLPAGGPDIKLSVDLQESYERRIEKEKSQYSKEYIYAAGDVLDLCTQAVRLPRFSAASVTVKASKSFDELKKNYPAQKEAALTQALGKAVSALEEATNLFSPQNDVKGDAKQEKELLSQASRYLDKIEKGLWG